MASPSPVRQFDFLRLLFFYTLSSLPPPISLPYFIFFAFVHVSRLQPRLSCRLGGGSEGTSLLATDAIATAAATADILTGDTLGPLAYGNSVKPGLIVTSAVLGEVFGEVQA